MGANEDQDKLSGPSTSSNPDGLPKPKLPLSVVRSWLTFLHRLVPETRDTIAYFAILLSATAVTITVLQNKATNAVAVATTFSALRTHYHTVDADLPDNYTIDEVRYQPNSKPWRKVSRYWDTAFDEWFVSNQLHAGNIQDLWKDFYAEAIGLSLRYPAMRAVYCDMDYGDRGQTTARQKFHAAITEVFASMQPGTALCPVPKPKEILG